MSHILFIKPMLDWVSLHPNMGELATFIFAFAESIAIIGLFVPGSVILTAIGTLVGSGLLPTTPTIAAAILGAILGDTFSYWLGYHYSEFITHSWPLKKYPALVQKGKEFFRRHGGKSVFIGRFCGPVRPLTPLIAGMLRLNPLTFGIATTLSGIAWAIAYMMPGFFLGAASLYFPKESVIHFAVGLLLGIIILWCAYWLAYQFMKIVYYPIDRLLRYTWYRMQKSPKQAWLRYVYLGETTPTTRYSGQFHLTFWAIVCCATFLILLRSVLHHGILLAWNEPIYHFFRTLRSPELDYFALLLTCFGDKKVLLPMVIVLFVILCWNKKYRAGIHLVGIGFVAAVIGSLTKSHIAYARPAGNLVTRPGFSFPSGHTLLALTIFGFLAFLFARYSAAAVATLKSAQVLKDTGAVPLDTEKRAGYQRTPWYFAVAVVLIVGITRLYLNEHWFTDVIGSILLGGGILFVTILSYDRRPAPSISPKFLSYTIIATFSLFSIWFLSYGFQRQLRDIQPVNPLITIDKNLWWQQTKTTIPMLNNRFGSPRAAVNVEWAARDLISIQETLKSLGWKTERQSKLHSLSQHFSVHHHESVLPIFSLFYLDRPYQLEMVFFKKRTASLVLELWQSQYLLNEKILLYYGRLFYYAPSFLDFIEPKVQVPSQNPIQSFAEELMHAGWEIRSQQSLLTPYILIRSKEENAHSKTSGVLPARLCITGENDHNVATANSGKII